MSKIRVVIIGALLGAVASLAQADATLVYTLEEGGKPAVEKSFAIAQFFVRVDSSDDEGEYLLFQAGKFFPLYRVDEEERTYARLTPEVKATLGPISRSQPGAALSTAGGDIKKEAEGKGETKPATEAGEQGGMPDSPVAGTPAEAGDAVPSPQKAEAGESEDSAEAADPTEPEAEASQAETPPPSGLPKAAEFKPTPKTAEIAGVRCRIVHELIGGEPAVEHCMANEAALGITEREARTLARLFVMARERGYDWLGAATKDEEFVSVQSRDLKRGKTLTLKSVSTKALPVGYLRVPRAYKEVEAEPAAQPGKESALTATEAATSAEEAKEATPAEATQSEAQEGSALQPK